MVDRSVIASAYDLLANQYDQKLGRDGWMRRRLWRHFDRQFDAGDRVIDAGCGTGIDTIHLASRGVRISAIDASSKMIARLLSKVGAGSGNHVPDTFVGERNTVLAELPGSFAGIVSSFAALNTVDLHAFAGSASRLLRLGGRVSCHMLSPGFHGHRLAQIRTALWGARRCAPERVPIRLAGRTIEHVNLHPLKIYRRYFVANFEKRACYARELAITPKLESWTSPRILDLVGAADALIGSCSPLLSLGRFFVLDLERRAG